MTRRPKVCFLPVTMKLFWQLYPQLEENTKIAMERVKAQLMERFVVLDCGLVGDIDEAQKALAEIRHEKFDLLVVWENGYVASGIPTLVIEGRRDVPVALLVTQRDKCIPKDMDYARYMESTATTSAMELGGVLARKGIGYETFVGHMDGDGVYDRLARLARAAEVYAELHSLRVGNIGYPYPGMLDICVDDAGVGELGASVERVTLLEVEQRMHELQQGAIDAFLQEVAAECVTDRVKKEDLHRTARLYKALEAIVREKELGALCVHDYECLSVVSQTVADFALSYLENRYGLATGVEGDMPNCLSAFVARGFSGNSPMFVDWTMYDEEENAIFLQHNGKADPAIVEKPVLSPSAEPFGGVVGDGVVFEAAGKPGPVTMVSMIYRADGWRIFAAEGEAIAQEARPCRLNQMTVRVQGPVQQFLEQVCALGIGHHLNVGYTHFRKEVEYLAKLLGIPFLTIQ